MHAQYRLQELLAIFEFHDVKTKSLVLFAAGEAIMGVF